jgi:trigger factor
LNITVTAEEPKDNKVSAKLTVAAADVDKAINKAYKDVAKKYNFQGFRRGKAPRPVIDGMVGKETVLAQATNDVLNAAEPLALEQLDVTPVGQPSFGDEPALLVEHADYVCELSIEVRPAVELESYDAPEVNLPPEEATEAEIQWQIDQLMSYQTTYEDTDEDREVAEGDIVNADVVNVEGAAHLSGEGRTLMLNGQQLQPEFQAGIIGMKKGETKDIEWTWSHESNGETKEHTFKVTVTLNAIKKAVTPELNDELAKNVFGYDDVEAFKAAVKEEIESEKKRTLPELKEDRVVEAMGSQVKLDEVPENYKNEIFNELAQEFLSQLQRQNVSLDMFLRARGIKSDDLIADLHTQADERARQSLALDAVAAKMGFEASEDDVTNEFEKAGVSDVKASVEQWRSEGRLPAIRDSIKRTKALDWLVENAKVTIKDEVAERAAEKDSDAE